jgi:hypothetical protein
MRFGVSSEPIEVRKPKGAADTGALCGGLTRFVAFRGGRNAKRAG